MKRNGLSNKKILVVSERTDILRMLEDKIKDGFPKCRIDIVTNAEEACRATMLFSYQLLIVDESNFKKLAHSGSSPMQNFPLLILTENGKLTAEQKNSLDPNVYGYLPANRPEEIIPILPRLLSNEFTPRWQRPFKRYGGIFNLGTIEAAEKLFENGLM
jgi:hypothetical protein